MLQASGWTEEREHKARQLWAEGYPASHIAAEVGGGISRNAILGKVHREGWPRVASFEIAWTDQRKREVARLYESDVPLDVIAAQVGGGITPAAIKTHAYRNALRRPKPEGPAAPVRAKNTSPALAGAARVDRAPKQGRDRDAQKAAATQPARRAASPGLTADHGKSSRSAAAGSKGAAANRSRWSVDPPPRPDNEPVTLLDLQHNECRWPLGDPQDFENFRYCGARHEREGTPYCAHHARLAYTPSVPRSLRSLDPDNLRRNTNNLDRISRFTGARP